MDELGRTGKEKVKAWYDGFAFEGKKVLIGER